MGRKQQQQQVHSKLKRIYWRFTRSWINKQPQRGSNSDKIELNLIPFPSQDPLMEEDGWYQLYVPSQFPNLKSKFNSTQSLVTIIYNLRSKIQTCHISTSNEKSRKIKIQNTRFIEEEEEEKDEEKIVYTNNDKRQSLNSKFHKALKRLSLMEWRMWKLLGSIYWWRWRWRKKNKKVRED